MSYACLFHKDKCCKFAALFCDDKSVPAVCCWADIKKTPKNKTTNLNQPNPTTFQLSLQDKVILQTGKCFLKAICGMETTLWRWSVSTIMWLYCQIQSKCVNYKKPFLNYKNLSYLAHLKNLESDFSNMFKNLSKSEFQCILDPFAKNIKMQHLPVNLH